MQKKNNQTMKGERRVSCLVYKELFSSRLGSNIQGLSLIA